MGSGEGGSGCRPWEKESPSCARELDGLYHGMFYYVLIMYVRGDEGLFEFPEWRGPIVGLVILDTIHPKEGVPSSPASKLRGLHLKALLGPSVATLPLQFVGNIIKKKIYYFFVPSTEVSTSVGR